MLLKIVYVLTCRILGLVVLLCRGDRTKDAELLVLRHENAVLRRQAGRVRYEPAGRVWFTALARLLPRRHWAEVFPVCPATLLGWHRRLAANKYGTSRRRTPSRPPARTGVKRLVLRLAGVTTVRTDLLTINFIVGAVGDGGVNEDDFLDLLAAPDKVLGVRAQAIAGHALAPPAIISLGGYRSLLLQISSQAPGQRYGQAGVVPIVQNEVHVVVGRRQYVMMFSGPAWFNSDLLPAFWTMLRSWRWS